MEANFNSNYTFNSFIVNDGNELVFAVAKAIVNEPLRYNPFFLYGKWRSGKTHLLHAIGNAMKKGVDGKNRILYVAGEQFHTALLNAHREKRVSDFIKLYQNYDVVMIDNIEAYTSEWMTNTQKAIVEIIDVLVNNKQQVIITSELQPDYLPVIYEHFRSTYESGIIADIVSAKDIVSSGVG